MTLRIDYEFLARMEGECKLNVYVPDPEGSNSGPTISTGFDLGARNEYDLKKLGINGQLLKRFRPYLGLQGMDALAFVKKNPMKITLKECHQVDAALKSHFASQVTLRYNSAIAAGKIKFEELPSQAQTVIMSVSYQYGDPRVKTPFFWSAVLEQDWGKVVAVLENFGDRYKARRKQEAKLLREIVK
ncbi:MAG: pesticin C-terminus-like muramidase [Burkholderiales bacterium]|jgi:hypothetical protein|uniref:pesticin C-terminus-like muramidase n=1 Tax=Limnobacter sp. TaxID=2003368 RepID=UPI0039509606|nr:pesticin C-terminus-like muramidase [Burkholderiales bacterium]